MPSATSVHSCTSRQVRREVAGARQDDSSTRRRHVRDDQYLIEARKPWCAHGERFSVAVTCSPSPNPGHAGVIAAARQMGEVGCAERRWSHVEAAPPRPADDQQTVVISQAELQYLLPS